MSADDFIDYCVMEAVFFRIREEDEKAEKKAQREEWKRKPVGSN